MSEDSQTPALSIFAGFSEILIVLFIGFQALTTWQWSILMDDVVHVRDFSAVHSPSALQKLSGDFIAYWHSGRLYPVKYVMNLLEYRYLTATPLVIHLLHAIILLMALGLTSVTVLKKNPKDSIRWRPILFFIGLGLLQRPLLDIGGLGSIAEVWTIVLLAWGLYLFPDSPIGYRVVLFICAFSKEPAVTVFLASGLVHLKNLWHKGIGNKSRVTDIAIDLTLFVTLALLMRQVQKGGTYLAGYNLLDVDNIRRFLVGSAKVLVGLTPALALTVYAVAKGRLTVDAIIECSDVECFCLIFAMAYLALVAPRGVPGYLLIPPAFAIWAASCGLLARVMPIWSSIARTGAWAVGALFVVSAGVAMTRYIRYVQAINESTVAFNAVRGTQTNRLVISNATEASMTAASLAASEQVPVQFLPLEKALEPLVVLRDFKGEVVLFEFSKYFGRLPDPLIESYRAAVGGWTKTSDTGICRIFYGVHNAH